MYQNIKYLIYNFSLILTLGILVLFGSGCSRFEFISDYDEATDKAVTALQRKTEAHFVKLDSIHASPACKYIEHMQFYDEARVDVSAIFIRASAIPKNEQTTEQTKALMRSLDNLSKLHQISCLSKGEIKVLRTQFNVIFTAILKLELAKRRGK